MRRRYKEAIKSLTDPTATPEQRAQLAQRAIDNANRASRRIDELIPNGGYAARSMQDTLTGIVEEMKPYTSGDVLLAPQYRPVPRIPQVSGFAEFKAMQNTGLQRMPTFDKFIAMRYGDTEEYRNLLARYQNITDQRDWSAVEFNPETPIGHFANHASAMGFSSAEGYGKAAVDFVNTASDKLSFADETGITRYFSKSTGVFASVYPDGTVRTFFKPRKGIQYWEGQVKKYGTK